MLRIKFLGNRSNGSGEDFCRVFNIYGHGGHLGYVIMSLNFNFLVPKSLHTKFGSKWPANWFLRNASFNFHMQMALGHCQEMT